MTKKQETKKQYTPPTLTDHGNAVEKTRGCGGSYLEMEDWRTAGSGVDP
jgi:hypothetical protein